jgi:hypothetical protein
MMFLTAAAAAATRRCAVGQFPVSVASVLASSGRGLPLRICEQRQTMGTIADGVDFDVIAREWRCKWSEDNDKKSLKEAHAKLTQVLSDLKGIDGCKSVHRVVCGGNLDFKVVSIWLYGFCSRSFILLWCNNYNHILKNVWSYYFYIQITSITAEKFGAWSESEFEPEQSFLKELSAIDGIDTVETQTYTFVEM